MYISGESLVVILLAGLIAGWLAGKIVAGGGFGLIGDIAVGIVGAFIGSWLLLRLGIHIGSGFINTIIVATIGAVVLVLIIRLLSGAFPQRRWGLPWRRRWRL
ncbi:GlsB/YeaQ/YmgE family stress response membrane protein [Bradyrhizobium sp. Arg68]|uniref:GlsB/YeaQ/YmgE family stress response membrane protein n=1 Tax=Bradyrhizobium ivorense TaxID=2511166 RepID=UPI001E3DFCCC|nr:GlsB/YeaQ/YmgE family stress response membrane protein [Bradyrhizobium ivorense]MCC8941989.1 GlsB/YeaQ/YmgE family stress response membrane protein [Bradyrhizobium ivorense]